MTQAFPPNYDITVDPFYVSPVYSVGKEMLSDDTPPTDIIKFITNPAFDNETGSVSVGFPLEVTLRQYGCVDLTGRSAGYTGKDLEALYFLPQVGFSFNDVGYQHKQSHTNGTVGSDIVYTAQGNIVTNDTIPILSETFETVDACDLAERLYLSLAAVYEAEGGLEGDVRCFESHNASGSSVFIHVDAADGTEVINIDLTDSLNQNINQWPAFKEKYEEWRSDNPCTTSSMTKAPTTSPTASPTSAAGPISLGVSLMFVSLTALAVLHL